MRSVVNPIGDMGGPVGTEEAGRGRAQPVPLALVDEQLPGCPNLFEQPVRVRDRTQLVTFTRDNEIGTAQLRSDAPQGERLSELVKLALVAVARHVHEPQLERRRPRL